MFNFNLVLKYFLFLNLSKGGYYIVIIQYSYVSHITISIQCYL